MSKTIIISPFKYTYTINCIICEETVQESEYPPEIWRICTVCDKCKRAVMKMREMMDNEVMPE